MFTREQLDFIHKVNCGSVKLVFGDECQTKMIQEIKEKIEEEIPELIDGDEEERVQAIKDKILELWLEKDEIEGDISDIENELNNLNNDLESVEQRIRVLEDELDEE